MRFLFSGLKLMSSKRAATNNSLLSSKTKGTNKNENLNAFDSMGMRLINSSSDW
jgi:hypothetical protein